MSALRPLRLALFVVIGGFVAAAVYISVLIGDRQATLGEVARYNTSWLASQAVGEFMRLQERIAAYGVAGSTVDKDEVQLRLDILRNRVSLLNDGEFRAFVDLDPERVAIVAQLDATVETLDAMVNRLEAPGSVQAALQLLAPLDAKVVALASAANRYGADRVAEDQAELLWLHWVFSGIAYALIACGIGLGGFLLWHNRALVAAHAKLGVSTQSLARASGELRSVNDTLQTRNGQFDAALTNMSQGLCMVDGDGRLIVCNQRFVDLFGLPAAAAESGTRLRTVLDRIVATARFPSAFLRDIFDEQKRLADLGVGGSFQREDDEGETLSVAQRPMPGGGWVATYEDATERRRAEAQIAYMAHHDALTGLANRVLFREHLELALARGERTGESIAVLCLDLDHFKDVNDTLGHPVGDQLLKAVAERLRLGLRETDVVARLGGDEFALLQIAAEQPREAGVLASRIVESLSAPYDIDGQHVVVGASVGVAIGAEGASADGLLKAADMALYKAKGDGRGTYRFFEPAMDEALQARRALEVDLRKALAGDELELYYQPVIDLRADEIAGFEALLRWRHPERGFVSPAEFIPIAEETGIIVPLGEWALRRACAQATLWPPHVKIAVNLSPVQFKSRGLVQAVIGAIAASGLNPRRLELEITESVLLQDNEATLATLHRIRDLGVRIAMDDFGTGYSSLSYLRSFPFDKIKIDQSFVRELSGTGNSAAIVHSIAGLGASLGMAITAEGVETLEQLLLLRAAGCTEAQGYYFARPKPAAELVTSLAPPAPASARAA